MQDKYRCDDVTFDFTSVLFSTSFYEIGCDFFVPIDALNIQKQFLFPEIIMLMYSFYYIFKSTANV